MDPILFPIIAIAAYAALKKPKVSSGELYKPTPQGNFKSSLDPILWDLEETIQTPFIRDYLMTIGYIESRYYPSSITHEPGMGWEFKSKDETYTVKKIFPNNKWVGQKNLWEYTGGLFQLFPYVALNTNDDKAKRLSPVAVFDPYYTIAFATDLIYRLNRYYDAKTWLDIRLGWRSLRALKEKNPKEVAAVKGRLLKSTEENGINPDFLYEPVSFGNYKQYKATQEYIETFRKKS